MNLELVKNHIYRLVEVQAHIQEMREQDETIGEDTLYDITREYGKKLVTKIKCLINETRVSPPSKATSFASDSNNYRDNRFFWEHSGR